MSTKFPPETLQEIFWNLKEDASTLHSCLLVNRLWCDNAIVVLWHNPFELCPSAKLLNALLPFIRGQRILENKDGMLRLSPKPFYYYPGFLRVLSIGAIYQTVADWSWTSIHWRNLLTLVHHDDDNATYEADVNEDIITEGEVRHQQLCHQRPWNIFGMSIEICNFFFRKSRRIERLSLWCTERSCNQRFIPHFHYNGFHRIECDNRRLPWKKSPNCLSGLSEFECFGPFDHQKLFDDVAQNCKHIESIKIAEDWSQTLRDFDFPNEDRREALKRLLEEQKNLKEADFEFMARRMTPILVGLESQARSLTRLVFQRINFGESITLEPISKCTNLEELRFINCFWVTKDALAPLTRTQFSKLKKFEFCEAPLQVAYHVPPISELCAIFRNLGSSLQELKLDCGRIQYESLFQKVATSNPNIISLQLNIPSSKTSVLIDVLDYWPLLNTLIVTVEDLCFSDFFNADRGTELSKRLSRNIETLHIEDWIIGVEELDVFLEKCGDNLKSFKFRISGLREHYRKIIKRYAAKKGVRLERLEFTDGWLCRDFAVIAFNR
ncbi:13698_t:CDS:1 [Ambispora leptoticha]|uniref:13698_t:CDS:1 n=1 Tax=Ambispora leptoticha TaxID=144679 RepID=A0A9N9BYW8_9GLOM|nr:13698_t:CDS:1 [Ambispora leptoticha]